MSDELSPEEDAILSDLAERAGRIATRLLEARDIAYFDDLESEDAREVLLAAWRAAAAERFAGQDISELHAGIDAMVESLVTELHRPWRCGLQFH